LRSLKEVETNQTKPKAKLIVEVAYKTVSSASFVA